MAQKPEPTGVLQELQAWFRAQCDEDQEYEESGGIRIETLDNPGWRVTVHLDGTALAGVPFAEKRSTISTIRNG